MKNSLFCTVDYFNFLILDWDFTPISSEIDFLVREKILRLSASSGSTANKKSKTYLSVRYIKKFPLK